MKKKFNLKEKFKRFFSKIGAFFKHIWKKYCENWFRIVVCLIALFVASCGFFRSCKNEKSSTATLQATADEVEQVSPSTDEVAQVSQRSINSIYDYKFNFFNLYNAFDFSTTRVADIVTVNEDGSTILNGTNSSSFYQGNIGVLSVENGALQANKRYYFGGSKTTNGGIGYFLSIQGVAGNIFTGFFNTTDSTVINVHFNLPAITYDNMDISPILTISDTAVPWTPPISILRSMWTEYGFGQGADYGYDNGYYAGYNQGSSEGYDKGYDEALDYYQMGDFRDGRLDFTVHYEDGTSETSYIYDLFGKVGRDVIGIKLGEIVASLYDVNLDTDSPLKSVDMSFSFSEDVTFWGFDFQKYPLCLNHTDSISNISVIGRLNNLNWVATDFNYDTKYNFDSYSIKVPVGFADDVYKIQFTFTGNAEKLSTLYFFTPNNDYQAGVLAGQKDMSYKVNEAYNKGLSIGYNRGREVDSKNYSFLSLIDAVGYGVTKPFVSILNFDLLGMNMLSFVTGLLTLVLIVKLCSLFI